LPTQQTTVTSALATPPGFLLNTGHGGRIVDVAEPHPTVCASDDRLSLVLTNRAHGTVRPAGDEPLTTVCAGGNHHHALVVRNYGNIGGNPGRHVTPVEEPLRTLTTTGSPALLMRNHTGGAEMVTPVDEPARTMTTAGHQSLLVPYNNGSQARPVAAVMPTATTRDRVALVTVGQLVDDCGFRMLEPHEVAAAMAFPSGYIPRDLAKVVQVKLAGNAVTPPVMTWIVGRILQALEAAA
jgi:DNA (cytosine-5)-methyltransferase 1